MSIYYSLEKYTDDAACEMDVLFLANSADDRARFFVEKLSSYKINLKNIIVIKYHERELLDLERLFPNSRIIFIEGNNRFAVLKALKALSDILLGADKITIDISCIRVPEIFTVIKYLQYIDDKRKLKYINIIYSVPYDYEFPNDPFISFRSYYGNLRTNDVVGFGGMADGSAHTQMIVFMGFEGGLSSKVVEDIRFDELILVNNLPSFYPKYKDTSVINNYDLISSQYRKIKYVPANNPFETFNFLDALIKNEDNPCIAPLSTKPVALGVCLYALFHNNVRVVYPVSDDYIPHISNKVLTTYEYKFPLHMSN